MNPVRVSWCVATALIFTLAAWNATRCYPPLPNPLVLDFVTSSQALTSWVPLPYRSEAKILFRKRPHFFQIGYRQGPGSDQVR